MLHVVHNILHDTVLVILVMAKSWGQWLQRIVNLACQSMVYGTTATVR